jgi:hypothetical protein
VRTGATPTSAASIEGAENHMNTTYIDDNMAEADERLADEAEIWGLLGGLT